MGTKRDMERYRRNMEEERNSAFLYRALAESDRNSKIA